MGSPGVSAGALPPAAILAGGLGTRLEAILPGIPKCMAPVGGRPFLERLLERLAGQGVREVVLCVGHLREPILAHFGTGARLGVTIRYAVEEKLRGTGGALANARPFLAGDFFLLNGDTYAAVDYARLYAFHRDRAAAGPSAGTIVTARVPDQGPYGSVGVGDDGRVAAFLEKVPGRTGTGWINAGVYVLAPSIFRFIPRGRPSSLEREVIPAAMAEGLAFYAFPCEGIFVDIGTPEGYRRARQLLP